MALERILVLDDEMVIRKALEEQLRRRRYSVVGVATLADATRQLEKDDFDLVFSMSVCRTGTGPNCWSAWPLRPAVLSWS